MKMHANTFRVNSPIPGQSPISDLKKPLDPVLSQYSKESGHEEIKKQGKVADSMDKIFNQEQRTVRQNKKFLISDISSSNSRERDRIRSTKAPIMLKGKSNEKSGDKNMHNINKELAKKYAGKLDLGKVRICLTYCA